MTALGMGGSAKPKPRPGDMERGYQFNVSVNGDLKTREYLKELVTAQAAHDKARVAAEAAEADAKDRDAGARQAEDNARSQRAALATATEEADKRIRAERAELATERQRLTELSDNLKVSAVDLTEREAALRRAFDAYNEGE